MKIKYLYALPIVIVVFFAGYAVNSQTLKGFIGEKYYKQEYSSVENKTASGPCSTSTSKTESKPKGTTTVDINPPKLDEIDLSKETLNPEERFTILIKSEEYLLAAEATIHGQKHNLPALEWSDGIYYNTVNAPSEEGEWPIKITLTDEYGNELIVDEAATIEVVRSSPPLDYSNQFEFHDDQPNPPSPGKN